jgi:hypothetical protein
MPGGFSRRGLARPATAKPEDCDNTKQPSAGPAVKTVGPNAETQKSHESMRRMQAQKDQVRWYENCERASIYCVIADEIREATMHALYCLQLWFVFHRLLSVVPQTKLVLECTYDQPSNRRRNPAPAYIEALERRLQKAEAILRTLLPGINLDDPKFDAHDIDQIIDSSREAKPGVQPPTRETRPNAVQDDDAQLQTMVEGTASLELDDQGHWDYHGESSGFAFIRNLRAQFGDLFVPGPRIPSAQRHAVSHVIESPKSASSSSYDFNVPLPVDLPDRATAMHLCRNTLDVACALIRFVHKPSFYGKVNRIFETDPDNYTNADTQFLPLLYVVIAEGCLFAQTEDTKLATVGYESAIEQG